MKRAVILFGFLFLLMSILPLALADEQTQIDDAYSCLNDKLNSSGCNGLSAFEERVFSLLSLGECYEDVARENSSNECWPRNNCGIKSTALALTSLYNYNEDYNTTPAEDWLIENKIIPEDIEWLLEIDSDDATSCSIYYESNPSGIQLNIGEDKKISSSDLGECFALSNNDYLLEVSPECYNIDLDVSCNEDFLTTLLFRKQDSTTLNVLEKVHSASAQGTTTEKVNSWCFSNPSSGSCDYEGSLWASQILFYLDNDVSDVLPYLVAFSEDNEEYLPESFLYYLTGEYRNELLSQQIANKYWINSGDEYYDTALALMPLQYESPAEKENSKVWLLDQQEEDGCWDNGNYRNTAFILFSVWPRSFELEEPECVDDGDCEDDEYCNDDGICVQEEDGVVCGDGIVNGTEECDGTNLSEETCVTLDFSNESGDLGCYAPGTSRECEFDTSECICEDDDDCPDGYGCSTGGQCLEEGGSDYECEDDDDCKSDEECSPSHICVEKTLDCEDEGYFCMSSASCPSGKLLSDYYCRYPNKCCEEEKSYGTCRSQNGEICSSDESCDGTEVDADNLLTGEVCCLGDCEPEGNGGGDENDCEDNNGVCRSSCLDDEKESLYYSCAFGDVCCVDDGKSKSTWLIWVLLALVVLVVLGIVFREKLREWFVRLKTKFGKGRRKSSGLGRRPMFPSRPLPSRMGHNAPPRRILPPRQTPPSKNLPKPSPPKQPPKKKKGPSKELDDVLKKLRDIGSK